MRKLNPVALLATVLLASIPGFSQATVILNGTSYRLQAHPRVWLDGPSGALTRALSDTSNAGRANRSNPAYVALTQKVDQFVAAGYTDPFADYQRGDSFSHFASCAIRWQADGDPNSLACAKYGIDHIENMLAGSLGCDTTQSYCGQRFNDQDYTRLELPAAAQAYSIIRAQLSPGERALFASKLLNDNLTTHNGIDSNACTNQGLSIGTGTLASSGSTITLSGGSVSQLAVGSVIFDTSNNQVAVVASITDATHFIVNQSVTWSGMAFHYSPPWSVGNCGIIWFVKHHNAAPPLVPGQESNYAADYPTGNTFVYPAGNLTLTALGAYIDVGLALADDDTRAVILLQQAYNYYLANQYTYARVAWTGFTQSGAAYSAWRTHWLASIIAISIKNSIVNGPDLTGGIYLQRQLPYYYYGALPDNPTLGLTFQDLFFSAWDQFAMRSLWPVMWLYSGTTEAGYANYYARSVRNDFTSTSAGLAYNQGSYLPYSFIFIEPAQTSTNLVNAPTQYVFKDTDFGLCGSLGLTCTAAISVTGADVTRMGYAHAISRTGWAPTDDLVLIQGSFNDGSDHSGSGNWGAVHIYRKGYLLGGNEPGSNGNRGNDVLIELGGGDRWTPAGTPGYASIARWAGVNPTGDAQSRFAYALVDMTQAYNGSQQATRVHRHIIHFKKPGSQDYIVWYDDVATSSGGMKKAYLHYPLNGIAPGVAINFNGGLSGGGISNTQTGATLRTTVVATGGSNSALLGRDNADGSYTGSNGHTYRAYICSENPTSPGTCDASSTKGEWAVVHMPTTTGAAMPAIVQDTALNFRVVEIQDSTSPKVAAFAQNGGTYTAANFATTHPGIGQYVVAGLTAGRYNVTLNGSTIGGSPFNVNSGDNALYFEGFAGSYAIAFAGAATCDLNGDGRVDISDVQIAIGQALGTMACTNGDLNKNGTCDVVDVQRLVVAVLGGACTIGP